MSEFVSVRVITQESEETDCKVRVIVGESTETHYKVKAITEAPGKTHLKVTFEEIDPENLSEAL